MCWTLVPLCSKGRKRRRKRNIGCWVSDTYLPIFVIIISVPISWNLLQRSSFSSVTLTFGSWLAAAVLLLLNVPPPPRCGGVRWASNPKWAPIIGNPVIEKVEISMAVPILYFTLVRQFMVAAIPNNFFLSPWRFVGDKKFNFHQIVDYNISSEFLQNVT